mgnify:CR=1 FL=1
MRPERSRVRELAVSLQARSGSFSAKPSRKQHQRFTAFAVPSASRSLLPLTPALSADCNHAHVLASVPMRNELRPTPGPTVCCSQHAPDQLVETGLRSQHRVTAARQRQ